MIEPRIIHLPFERQDPSLGDEAVEFVCDAGLDLDEWQAYALRLSLDRREDGKWSASEVGLNVARQNGKGGILEARQLVGLFILAEKLQLHSAHNFDTSLEAWRRLKYLIENKPELDRQVKRYVASHGDEGIELKNGCRIRFRTRTSGGGRGFSGSPIYLDEDMYLPERVMGALQPILRAQPNPQLWYTGSAVDQHIHENGVVKARLRERALKGEASRLLYLEWSVEGDDPSDVPLSVLADQAAWAQANPALGIRIDPEHMAGEQESMDQRTFAVELLGIGDWPRTDHVSLNPIDREAFAALGVENVNLTKGVCLSFDVSPDRKASISAAGPSGDEWHVEVLESRGGTSWLPKRLRELRDEFKPEKVVCDGYGPAGSLIDSVEEEGVEVEPLDAGDHARACGQLIDAIEEKALRHRKDPDLDGAVKAAGTRPLGDAWAWSRKSSAANISPLVSVTLALSAAKHAEKESEEPVIAWG